MSHHTWVHRIARVGVRPLVATPISPNHLTTLRLATGLAAVAGFAEGSESWRYWGAGLFLVSMLLDRADGELARLSGKTSPWGHKYDLMADSFCNALAFVGLGIGLRASEFGLWAIAMGALAGLAVATILWLVIKLEEKQGARAAELAGAAGFDADDGMLAVPILVWLGLSEPLLIAATLGAPAFAIFMYAYLRRRSARDGDGGAARPEQQAD